MHYQDRDILRSMLNHKKGCSLRVFARKCEVVSIPIAEGIEFFNSTNMGKYETCSVILGLLYNNEIVAMMGFYDDVLVRYSNKLFTTVVGGPSKLLSAYCKTVSYSILYSSTVNKPSILNGTLYDKLGFYGTRSTKGAIQYNVQKRKLHD